ncbi:MAG: hypothetical protein EA366_14700 [Spirulina sp. DLM2.Bin59]|nr:MAG: hypothetical protein EA366_14700 [Spirulina sp. DLM2.Bin59]
MFKPLSVLMRYGLIGAIAATLLIQESTGASTPWTMTTAIPVSAPIAPPLLAQAEPEPDPEPNSEGPPKIQPGDQGQVVTQLQERLQRAGYYEGEPNGNYDEATAAAVRKLQTEAGLEPTGIFDVASFEALRDRDTSPETPAPPGRNWRRILLIAAAGITVFSAVGGIVYLLWRFVNSGVDPESDSPEKPLISSPLDPKTPITIDTPPPDLKPSPTKFVQDTPTAEAEVLPAPPPDDDWGDSPELDFLLNSLSNPRSQVSPPQLPASGSPEDIWDDQDSPLTASGTPGFISPNHYQPRSSLPISSPSLPKADVVEELIRDLQTSDSEKRRKVIWSLAQRADSRAVQPLVNLLLESDSQQQGLVLEALSQIAIRTLKPMNRALALSLQDDNAQVRKNAIRDLTRIYELIAQLSQLIYCATDDPDPDVQATAKWALNQLGQIRNPPGT